LNRKAELNFHESPLPPAEEERLKALHRCEILDPDPEQEFGRVSV